SQDLMPVPQVYRSSSADDDYGCGHSTDMLFPDEIPDLSVSIRNQHDQIQCLIDNLAQEYQNTLFPPASAIDLSSNVAPF
ncbi:unnamed protein product, partial [Didymodactylos carnosus]